MLQFRVGEDSEPYSKCTPRCGVSSARSVVKTCWSKLPFTVKNRLFAIPLAHAQSSAFRSWYSSNTFVCSRDIPNTGIRTLAPASDVLASLLHEYSLKNFQGFMLLFSYQCPFSNCLSSQNNLFCCQLFIGDNSFILSQPFSFVNKFFCFFENMFFHDNSLFLRNF